MYTIKNLNCGYPASERPVLEIERLHLNRGEVVFFVGASGVGKSTILETLGLMSNTIALKNIKNSHDDTIFNFETNNDKFDRNIWLKGEKVISEIRRKNFSFIFQQTNLFRHLSAYQNTMITQLINGRSYKEAKLRSSDLFNAVSLSVKNREDAKVNNFSGGQKQRIAFARALSSDKQVLFADEPTGNLDWFNAYNLMDLLKDTINNEKLAIIVSHDIPLTLKYASKIVVIEKLYDDKFDQYYGRVDDNAMFLKEKTGWKSKNAWLDENQMQDFLRETIKKQSEIFN